MKTAPLVLASLSLAPLAPLAALAAPTAAQEATQSPVKQPLATFQVGELQLSHFTPRNTSAVELWEALAPFYARDLLVEAETGVLGRRIANMSLFADTLVIFDSPEQSERIVAAAQHLEEILEASAGRDAAAAESSARYEVMELRPRFVTLDTLLGALSGFQRTLTLLDEHGYEYEKVNTGLVREPGLLVVRDTPENLQQMRRIVKGVDRPAPQVMLVAQLVQASDGQGDTGLPEELVTNLARLVGRDAFELLTTSTLRASAAPGSEVRMQLDTMVRAYSLGMRVVAYDPETRALTVENCALLALATQGDERFRTACTIHAGEYTVLGSSGDTPIFTVLRLVPLDGKTD
jgi:hypothetical protein